MRAFYSISLSLFLCLSACSGKFENTLGKNLRNNRIVAGTGKTLFAQKCSACHLEKTLGQATASTISEKISNIPAMQSLRVLSQSEIQEIASYLSTVLDKQMPSTPVGLEAVTLSDAFVSILWNEAVDLESGIKGYKVYRDGVLLNGSVGSNSYSDSTVKEKTAYKYAVQAEDGAGNLSAFSQELMVLTPAKPVIRDTTPPTTPSLGVSATSHKNVKLNWSASSDSGGMFGYEIYRDGILIAIQMPADRTYEDSSVSSNKTYKYKIRALDVEKNSAESGEETVATPIIDAVKLYSETCLSCHKSGGMASPVARNKTANEIKAPRDGIGRPMNLDPKVKALNDEEIDALALYLSDASDRGLPTAPSGVVVDSKTDSFVTVSWKASTDPSDTNEIAGSGIKGYKVYRDGVLLNGSVGSNSYSDSTVKEKTTYKYTVQAEDRAGNLSGLSQELVVMTPDKPVAVDMEKPSTPSQVMGTALSESEIEISWVASTDLGGSLLKEYRIYRGQTVIGVVVSSVLRFKESQLASNTTYAYEVTAVDGAGNESAKSPGLSITTKSVSQPPTMVQVNLDGPSLYQANCLSCHKAGGSKPPVARNTTAAVLESKIRPKATEPKSVMNFLSNLLTVDQVKAIALYLSDASDKVAPSVPNGLALTTLTDSLVSLSWTASSDPGDSNQISGSGLKGYKVYRDGVLLNGSVASNGFSDSDVKEKTTYKYTVKAEDRAGNVSGLSQELVAVTPSKPVVRDITPPTVPLLIVRATSHKAVNLNWSPSSDAGGIFGYEIYRDGTLLVVKMPTDQTYVDTTVTSNKTYKYKIRALDIAKNTSESIEQSVATPIIDAVKLYSETCLSCHKSGGMASPVARNKTANEIKAPRDSFGRPMNLDPKVKALNDEEIYAIALYLLDASDKLVPKVPTGLKSTSVTDSAVALMWNPSQDPADSNEIVGSGIKEYQVFRNGVLLASAVTGTTYLDGTVQEKITYRYKVQALDRNGNNSAQSSELVVTTPAKPVVRDTLPPTDPGSPKLLALSDTQVLVQWNKSTDNKSVQFYRIYRNGSSTPVAQVNHNQTDNQFQFVDSGLAPKSTYRYQISAVDSSGNISGKTDAGSITTLSPLSSLVGGSEDDRGVFSFQAPLPTGRHGASVMLLIFGGPADSDERKLIRYRFTDQVMGLGGVRSFNEGSSFPLRNSEPIWNAVRAGYVLNGCAQVLDRDNAVRNALIQCSLNESSVPDDLNIQRLYQMFFPEKTADPDLVGALKNIANAQGGSATGSYLDAWRLLLLPLCEFSVGGAL